MNRTIRKKVKGFQTVDGGGVKLVRVLGSQTAKEFDPILMLDSFDSTNPQDYIAGFPPHPHRGIETISYVWQGKMKHKDNLGFEDTVEDGEVQWMTAGSGIIHEEQLPASERMLGVQLWLNLPAKDKMTKPAYRSIKRDQIPEVELEGGRLRILAGSYDGQQGVQGNYQPIDYYDITVEPGKTVTIPTEKGRQALLFPLLGDVRIAGEDLEEKTAALLSDGDQVTIEGKEKRAKVLFLSGSPLKEEIAWGGPVVMNTREELQQAFKELEEGTFIK